MAIGIHARRDRSSEMLTARENAGVGRSHDSGHGHVVNGIHARAEAMHLDSGHGGTARQHDTNQSTDASKNTFS